MQPGTSQQISLTDWSIFIFFISCLVIFPLSPSLLFSIFCIQFYPITNQCTKCILSDIAITVMIITQWRPWFSQLLTALARPLLCSCCQLFSKATLAGQQERSRICLVYACLTHRKALTRHSRDSLSTHTKKQKTFVFANRHIGSVSRGRGRGCLPDVLKEGEAGKPERTRKKSE